MSLQLQLRLTGTPAVLQAGQPEQALDRQAALMAALLALQGPQPRGQLALQLWPDAADARARANLRQRLHRLKAAGGPAWWTGDAVLALAPEVQVLPPGDPDAGELLAGWSPAAPGVLASWLQQAREQARAEQLRTLDARAQAAEAARQPDQALAHRQRMLALDPLVEAHHRALMRLHYLQGASDQAQALHRHTGGNPLFVLETLKALGSEDGAPAAWPVAPTVPRLIQQRLGRLSPTARQVARCLAILGQDMSVNRVARLLDRQPLDLADAWAELEAAQVLKGEGLAHDLIAQAARDTLPEAIARPLHGQVAALLAQADDEGQQASAACASVFGLYQARQFEQASQLARAALVKARRADLAEVEVELLFDMTALAWHQRDERAASEHAERALARLDAVVPQTARLDPQAQRSG